MPIKNSVRVLAGFAAILAGLAAPSSLLASTYEQINLVSDIPGNAALTDPNLVDPWGVSFTATSPFWVSDNGGPAAAISLATLYTGMPSVNPTVVAVPGGPTGQVNNSTTGFVLGTKPASFIFDTQAGTILAWNGGTAATNVYSNPSPNASYTGLAIGSSGGNPYLYAANSAGTIDVFNSSFANVNGTTFAGKFVDPNLPAGYVPYNVQAIGSQLYVTYVIYNNGSETPSGLVDIYDMSGNFVSRFATGGPLDAPWGITLAPSSFGAFGGDILIGNFLNGEINVFDLAGDYLGALDGANGLPIADPGLWALEFRTGGTGNNTSALYFTAGINDETDGLLGEIVATPEPAPLLLGLTGLAALWLGRRMRAMTA